MIHSALNKNLSENKSSSISIRSLIKKCNEDIIREKELLYNFKFSEDDDLIKKENNPETDNFLIKKIRRNTITKEESYSSTSEDEKTVEKKEKKIARYPNIFKEKVKAFLKNKNLF